MVTEYQAAMLYTKLGYTVCWPIISQSPYDFVVEKDGAFKRVQVKTAGWVKSGNYSYLQSRLGSDKRNGSTNSTGCKYTGSCDEIIFIDPTKNDAWIFPVEVIAHTSNVCLASTNPNPKRSQLKKNYDPNTFKVEVN